MDFSTLLKGEIEKKKNIIQSARKSSSKYIKTSDLLDHEFEHKINEKNEIDSKRLEKSINKRKLRNLENNGDDEEFDEEEEEAEVESSKKQKLNDEESKIKEVQMRLRELGKPIRLYGEKYDEIISRYQMEISKLKEGQSTEEKNDIEPKKEDVKVQIESVVEEPVDKETAPEKSQIDELSDKESTTDKTRINQPSYIIDKNDVANNLLKLQGQCRDYIKYLLSLWDCQVENLTEQEKLLLVETKRWLLPLLIELKRNQLNDKLLISLSTILINLQNKEFNLSNENYIKLSIGNIAWPIGVVNVGIHSRSAHSKLEGGGENAISNIMKDEKTRRWILALKRLITFYESYDGLSS